MQIWDDLILLALREDIECGDITTLALFSEEHRCQGSLLAKGVGVVSGMDLFQRVFQLLDVTATIDVIKPDASQVKVGDEIARVAGKTQAILAGERVALNFLMRMSGIATATYNLQERLKDKGLPIKIADTRKTTPLWRYWEKKAVRDGGGMNHRTGLSDSFLIKDNHIKLANGSDAAVRKVLSQLRHIDTLEVEVTDISQIEPLLRLGVQTILLDNMTPDDVRQAVKLIAGRARVEVSGGITPENIDEYAIPGIHVISSGWLTQSAPALNFSLEITKEGNI